MLDVDEPVVGGRVGQAATEPPPAAPPPVYGWEAANRRKIDAVEQLAPLTEALDDLKICIAELLGRTQDLQPDWSTGGRLRDNAVLDAGI